jgi:membrane protease YdiL (CAAX protease family)
LALPDVEGIELVFDPTLFIIFIFLYLFIGFFEELLFRGYVQGFLMRRWGESYRGMLLSVLLTSLIFGGAHLVNLIMGRAAPLYAVVQFAYAVFFGVFFSALYVRSGSLFPGIGLHMLFDFMANLDAFRPGALPRSEIVRSSTSEAAFVGILITLPLFLIGLYYLRKSKLQFPPEGRRVSSQ